MLYYNWWLSDAASTIMASILIFHDILMMVLLSIAVLVGGIIWLVCTTNVFTNTFIHEETLEVVWTIFPILIFLVLAVPSISTLYATEGNEFKFNNSTHVFYKIIAHQWYWEIEIHDEPLFNGSWEMFMVPTNELLEGGLVNLEVDRCLEGPSCSFYDFLFTSADVLHSFALPSWGVKVDCVPGRLNQCFVSPMDIGVYYGQCSEICGANHSFMPIAFRVWEDPDFYEDSEWSSVVRESD